MRHISPALSARGARSLERWLARTGTSRAELGRRLGGLSGAMVSQWIHGSRGMTAERAIQIERVSEGAVSVRDLRPDLGRVNGKRRNGRSVSGA